MFEIKDRNSLFDYVMQLARDDGRIFFGALVGSLALDRGDQWSDLDLTFSVEERFSIFDILDDWTTIFLSKLNAAHLYIHTFYESYSLPTFLHSTLYPLQD